jgi:MFS family permease
VSSSSQLMDPRGKAIVRSAAEAQDRGRPLLATLTATFILRLASRLNFVVLSFYLGMHFTSATGVAIVLEAFYVSELVLSLATGGLSDRLGRRPFLLLGPVTAGLAAVCFLLVALVVPNPSTAMSALGLTGLIAAILFGRLLEGAAAGIGVPATLGFLTDLTTGSQSLRARAVTAFQVVTVGGLVLAIPVGGQLSRALNTWSFLVVVALQGLVLLLLWIWARDVTTRQATEHGGALSSLLAGLSTLRERRIATFLPAWLSVNALIGAWLTLALIILAYPAQTAKHRHPGQLLYGGFSKSEASLAVGLIAVVFMVGMVVWSLLLPRMRRSSVMLAGMGGLAVAVCSLIAINSLGQSISSLPQSGWVWLAVLLVPTVAGVLLLSGFTPAALTQLSAIGESIPGKTGAVMGLYSLALAVGQLVGTGVGGVFVDLGGFTGLMLFSALAGVLATVSVLYLRSHRHDLIDAAPSGARTIV